MSEIKLFKIRLTQPNPMNCFQKWAPLKSQQDLAAQIVCSSYVACNLSRLDSMMNEWSKLPITSILLPSCEPVNFLLHNPQGSNLAKANVIWKLIDVVMPTLRGHISKEVKILQKRGRLIMVVVTRCNGHERNCQLQPSLWVSVTHFHHK